MTSDLHYDTISISDVINTLRNMENKAEREYAVMNEEKLEGAYYLASELTGLSVDALAEKVH